MKKSSIFFLIIATTPQCLPTPEAKCSFNNQALPEIKLEKEALVFYDASTLFSALLQKAKSPEQACLMLIGMVKDNEIQLYSSKHREKIQCTICLEENPYLATELECHTNHIFCTQCISPLIKKGSCPLCRKKIRPKTCLLRAEKIYDLLRKNEECNLTKGPQALQALIDCANEDLKRSVNLYHLQNDTALERAVRENKNCNITINYLKNKSSEVANECLQKFMETITSQEAVILLIVMVISFNTETIRNFLDLIVYSLLILGYL